MSSHARPGPRTRRSSTASQPGQRATIPGAWEYTCNSATMPSRPQSTHRPRATVTSAANSSRTAPASSLPSTQSSTMDSPFRTYGLRRRAEPFGPHAVRLMAGRDEQVRRRLDEPGRPADEARRLERRRPPGLAQPDRVEPAHRCPGRTLAGVDVRDVEPLIVADPAHQLVGVDDG